jgi:hypothetical protein
MRGSATVEAWDKDRAMRILRRYLGPNEEHWDQERFVQPLDDPANLLVRFAPESAVTRDQSHRTPPAHANSPSP